MMKSLFIRLFVVSLVALLISVTSCDEVFALTAFGKGSSIEPGAAIFVSKQAPAMISILDTQLESLRPYESSLIRTVEAAGIDFRKDVQPWLGKEITLAVTSLDFDRDPDNGKLPGYLMAIATKSPEKSREFVQLFFSKQVLAGSELSVEEFAGVKIITAPSEKGMLAGAVVGDKYLLFANDPKVLREAINNVQAPDLNLTTTTQYEQVKQISPKSLGVAFLNLPIVAEWLGLKLPVQTFDYQVVTLAPAAKGFIAETVALSTTNELKAPLESLSKPADALRYIPASAGIAVGSKDLSSLENSNLAMFWQQLKSALLPQRGITITDFVQQDAESQKRWGVNLSKDIFAWVKGEYAIGLISNSQQANPDWIFVTETPQTPSALTNLDAIAVKNGLSITTFNLLNQPVTAWTELKAASSKSNAQDKPSFNIEAKAYGVHTTINNYEIFTSSLETMHEVLTIEDNTLLNNRNFQKSVAALPESNAGYVYINWAASQPILERQLPVLKLLKILAKPFFNNLRSLTVTNYGNDNSSLKGDVFFQFEE